MTLPLPSPIICTSICLGVSTNRSMNTLPSPNAANASDDADSKKGIKSSRLRTTRIPLPPPPMAALMITGSPISSTKLLTSSAFSNASLPGTTGTPESIAAFRALVLSLNVFKFSTVGPTKVIPASAHACANCGDSLKNPYPGCIASTPLFLAISMICGMSRYALMGVALSSFCKT